jgi:hypothetical protein
MPLLSISTRSDASSADDAAGAIVDVSVTTGAASEGQQLLAQVEQVETNTGTKVGTVTADGAYAHGRNYAALESRGTQALIPPQAEPRGPKRTPGRRFQYDGRHQVVRCPAGKVLRRSHGNRQGWMYWAKACDRRPCPLRARCIAPTATSRVIIIGDGDEALLRARRHRQRWDQTTHALYARHRWRAEGVNGEAKTCHGLRRAARRRLWNVAIQAYLTAAVLNLKRLAARLLAPLRWLAGSLKHVVVSRSSWRCAPLAA